MVKRILIGVGMTALAMVVIFQLVKRAPDNVKALFSPA